MNQEMSCIEVLLNHLINGTELNSTIFSEFTSTKTFNSKRTNLFNLISIDNLIKNYTEIPPFSLEEFLFEGTIQGEYSKPTITPIADPKYVHDPESFIANLVEALKEDNYLFDEDNNVFVSSTKLEATIPQAWLYRLSEGYKRKQFNKLFFYNKNTEADISDKLSLIDYIRHTKTFLVNLSGKSSEDCAIEFAKAEALTNHEIKEQQVVRVEDLIKLFQSKLPRGIVAKIGRYKLTDLFFITGKAEQAGPAFYSKPLEEQKEIINDWIIDFIESNKKANESAQEYLLLGDESECNKKDVIAGLINLYFEILSSQELDFDDISLTDFKITTYMSENLQQSIETGKTLVQALNRFKNEKADISRQLAQYSEVLSKTEISDRDFKDISSKVSTLTEKYHIIEQEESKYKKTSDYLQETIREEQASSLLNISFANNEIIALLLEATRHGRVYISEHGSKIIFELYNNEIGKTTFKASITTEELLTVIENINYSLREKTKR